jgi:polyisoprenoid-binding protein YceI
MTKLITISIAAAAATMFAFTGKQPHATNYKLDTKASSVEWTGEKLTGKHTGTIMLASGTLTDTHNEWTGTFDIDMTTITDTDMEAGKGKEKLEGHLKSPDFFDVAKYPTAKFVVSSITPLAAATETATHNVKGFLTIKDKSNAISFDVKMDMTGEKIMCAGTAVIDRSKYDVRYGSKTFFAEIGDKAISDEFSLKFNVTLTK